MSGDESARSKKEWKYFTKIGVTVFLTFACCIIFFFAILRYEGFAKNWNKIMQAAQPITTGLVLAYIFNPVLGFFENIAGNLLKKRVKDDKKRKKYSRGIGVAASIIVLILFITLLIAAIVPAVIDSVRTMLETLPENVESLIYQIQHGKLGKSQIADIVSNYITIGAEKIEDWAKNYLMPEAQHYIAQITTGVISVVKGIFNFVIGIIVMAYVMTIKERLKGQSKKIIYAAFKPKVGNLIVEAVRKTNEIFGGFITGKIIDSAIVGVICYFGCLIMGIPDAVLIAVVVGVTNVIPVFGPFIGAVPSILLVVIQSPWHALYLLIFILVLQQVDGNIIGPKILGSSTGLSSFWVMFAILLGGGLFGFLGMLLGVPVVAVIYYIVDRIVNYKVSKNKLPTETEKYIDMIKVDEKTNTLTYPEIKE
ncbi:MAG: AI-2E family transporter [Agathobacter sp.]|nr:AI-2E family transporter [Agathobacter sp.]